MFSGRGKLLLAALIVRLIVAPFTMHLWDVNTIQNSVYQFINGVNPYEYVYNVTKELRDSTGLPINYEGYTYLPHILFIFLPFYKLYVATGAEPLPIKGVLYPTYIQTFRLHRDIYFFLLVMKTPLIIIDLLIVLIMYNNFGRKLAFIYAFSPYVILVTSIWGMFDNFVALTLLLTVILLRKNKVFYSGLMYGLSLVKFYTIYVTIPLLYNVWTMGKFRSLLKFTTGLLLSQIPTLYFFAINPTAFIQVTLGFHATRVGGGVTPLNVLWSIRDQCFNVNVSTVASMVSLTLTLLVSIYCVLKKMDLYRTVIYVSFVGVLLGKIVNEQYFIPIYLFLLIYSNEVAVKLSYGYLFSALVRNKGVYLFFPALTLLDSTFNQNFMKKSVEILLNEPLDNVVKILLFTLGTVMFIYISTILLALNKSPDYPKNSGNPQPWKNQDKLGIKTPSAME